MASKTQTVRSAEDAQAVVRNLEQISDTLQASTERVESLEDAGATQNAKQDAVPDISYSEPTISPAYVQAEIEQLTADIKTVADKVDALIASLQSANILNS